MQCPLTVFLRFQIGDLLQISYYGGFFLCNHIHWKAQRQFYTAVVDRDSFILQCLIETVLYCTSLKVKVLLFKKFIDALY